MAKTRDGIRLSDIISAVRGIEGVGIRQGTKHPYMLMYGQMRPCPVAESTDAKYMIVPWLRQILPYDNRTIYSGLRRGSFER